MDSRSTNIKRNIIWATVNRVLTLVIQFFNRTVFIYCLGDLYLGLSGLFTSTLNFLALAELGIGSALIFSMYKPLADGDDAEVCALLNLYRRVYRIIGLSMLVIGLVLMMLLPYMIKGEVPPDANVYLLFLVYLLNTVLSYFLYAYKNSILIANQRSDLLSNISTVLVLITNTIQIVILLLFKDFLLYSLVFVLSTIANNLVINYVVNKRYPQFKCAGEVRGDQLADIKRRVFGVFLYRICYVFRDAIDAMFISAFIGLSVLGKYNNYMFVLNTITGFMVMIRTNITASIGNSLATESEDKNYADFQRSQMLYMWISIWLATCLFCLLQPFITLWVGKEYLLGQVELGLFCVYFLCYKLGDICSTYRQAAGLWWQDRFRPIVEAIAKVILNFLVISFLGVAGILANSIVCLLLINSIWASWVLYRYFFKSHRQFDYIWRNLYFLLITILIFILVSYLCNFIPGDGVMPFIYKCIISFTIPHLLLWLALRPLPEFKASVSMLMQVVKA